MIETEEKKIRRVYQLLIVTLGITVCSQLIAFFINSIEYIAGIIAAFVIAGIRYLYLRKKNAAMIERALTSLVVIMAIFGPIIFILVKWLILGEPILSIELIMSALFVIPIAIMLYCIFVIRGLLPNR